MPAAAVVLHGVRRMRPTFLRWTIWILAVAKLPLGAQVLLNEIMFDPSLSEFTHEYVELINVGDQSVDLSGWRVGDVEEVDALVDAGGGMVLQSGGYALVLDSGYFESERGYDPLPEGVLVLTVEDATIGSGGLSNGKPETMRLMSADGEQVSAVTYTIWKRCRAFGGTNCSHTRQWVDGLGGLPMGRRHPGAS